MNAKLVLHEPSLEVIRGMFARRQREMPERNVVQAMFPEGSEPIPNRRGTAPGIYMEVPRPGRAACRLAAMPGVPSEMKVMFHDDVLPRIRPPEAAGIVIRHARVNCFGLGESAAEERLGDVTARGRDPEVGITVHEATITLRIVAHAPTDAAALEKIAATKKIIYDRMGEYAFGEEDEELEHVVVSLLREKKQTLAIAEAATGGLVAQRLTGVSGSAECFSGGLIVSGKGWEAAQTWIMPAAVDPAGLVSAAAVRALAASCRSRFGADWALSIGECSRTDDHEGAAEAPLVFVALAGSDGTRAIELNVAGDPAIVRSRVAKSVLNLLRLHLLK
jgi:nicotinamide-nucleotide amidase